MKDTEIDAATVASYPCGGCKAPLPFNKDSAEFPHLLGGGMNAVQALACWLMKPLHYSPLLVLYTA